MKQLVFQLFKLLKNYSWLFFSAVVGIGILFLFLTIQNDFHSPVLFFFKSLLFPVALIFLCKLWFFAILWSKHLFHVFQGNGVIKFGPILIAFILSLLFLPTVLPNWKISPHFSPEADQSGFKVATFSAMTRSRNGEDIKRFIETYQPDVLCLQEVTEEDMLHFSELYPHEASHGLSNLRILSKIPFKTSNDSTDSSSLKSNKTSIQSVELDLPDGKQARMLNVHMPRQYRSDGNFAKTLKAIQLHTDTELPIIFCGDFNMTPHHSLYQYLTRQLGLNDAQITQRWQYGFTFPNGNRRLAYLGTWIRIDYLFSIGFLNGTTQVINASTFSDHKAVLSTFLLAKD